MAINQVRPDTPLANTPEPRFVQDTIKPKVMSYAEKRAAQEIVKQKNIAARENILNRNANAQNKTREEVRAKQEKDKKKPDQPCGDLNVGGANKRGKSKGSCTTGETNKGESLKDTK